MTLPDNRPASERFPPPPGLGKPKPDAVEAQFASAAAKQEELQLAGLAGTNTLLAAPPGTGKTYSLVTAIQAGLELFVVGTEANFEESLLEAAENLRVDRSKLHYAYVPPATDSLDGLMEMARKISDLHYHGIASIKTGISKVRYNQFLDLLSTLKNFKDQYGREYGSCETWGPDRMIAVDSLSGLNDMAQGLTVGSKPILHEGEWGLAMAAEEKLIKTLCTSTKCFFTLTAHVDKVMDATIGKPMLSASALGNKLAPKLPKNFSDFITAYREGDKFYWSTNNANMDLKCRTLPFSDKLEPSFVHVVAKWKERRLKSQQYQHEIEAAAAKLASDTGTDTDTEAKA